MYPHVTLSLAALFCVSTSVIAVPTSQHSQRSPDHGSSNKAISLNHNQAIGFARRDVLTPSLARSVNHGLSKRAGTGSYSAAHLLQYWAAFQSFLKKEAPTFREKGIVVGGAYHVIQTKSRPVTGDIDYTLDPSASQADHQIVKRVISQVNTAEKINDPEWMNDSPTLNIDFLIKGKLFEASYRQGIELLPSDGQLTLYVAKLDWQLTNKINILMGGSQVKAATVYDAADLVSSINAREGQLTHAKVEKILEEWEGSKRLAGNFAVTRVIGEINEAYKTRYNGAVGIAP